MKTYPIITLLLLLAFAQPLLADVYRWVDEQGRVVFGDSPPEDKKSQAQQITIENTEKSGTRFATPEQVKDFDQHRKSTASADRGNNTKKFDSRCRGYVSQLNKIEIYLEHTPTVRDQQKARDLRKLISKECGEHVYNMKYDDTKCQSYRDNLSKAQIYLEHTPNVRDQRRVNDLRAQIARECH